MRMVTQPSGGTFAQRVADFRPGRWLLASLVAFWPLGRAASPAAACEICDDTGTAFGKRCACKPDGAAPVARHFVRMLPETYIGSPEPWAQELATAVAHIEALAAVIEDAQAQRVAGYLSLEALRRIRDGAPSLLGTLSATPFPGLVAVYAAPVPAAARGSI